MEITPKEQMERIYTALSDKQGQDITVIDVQKVSDLVVIRCGGIPGNGSRV